MGIEKQLRTADSLVGEIDITKLKGALHSMM